MLGVLTHVIGDALNNIGVIISALVIWLTHYDARFYADPGVSMGIAIMILLSSVPLVKNSGSILMECTPNGVNSDDVKHDLEKVDGFLELELPRLADGYADTRDRVGARAAHLAS